MFSSRLHRQWQARDEEWEKCHSCLTLLPSPPWARAPPDQPPSRCLGVRGKRGVASVGLAGEPGSHPIKTRILLPQLREWAGPTENFCELNKKALHWLRKISAPAHTSAH